jgi:L-ascorbate metabolism protein UlaG (beta-lactamase superfamily)
MATQFTWLGHGASKIVTAGKTLLIDPFLTGQPTAPCKADSLTADYILLSHGHADHLGDTASIAKRCGATVICNYELSEYLTKQGVKAHGQQHGGGFQHGFGRVKLTIAHHGSALPDGSYGGNPCGFLLYLADAKIYAACDTGLFLDMQLIGDEGIDLAILPIGDNFTMGPDDAVRAVKLIRPKKVIPVHYNTWGLIAQDAAAWANQIRSQTTCTPVILKPGETCTP